MDLVKLRYFRAVAQTEHISQAAQKLHITQPALSKTISLLEEELGTPLFNRVGRRIELNEYGTAFLKYAESAIDAIDNGIRRIKEMENPALSKIKFQTNITGDVYLLDMIKQFKANNPNVRFEIIKNYSKSRFLNDCDLYIHAVQIPFYKCISVPIFKEEIVLGVPKNHAFGNLQHITLDKAANEAFITLDKSTSWKEETEGFCTKAGFKPNIVYECDGTDLIPKLIEAGEGVGFLPSKSWGAFPDGVHLIHIDYPNCYREYNLSWQLDKPYNHLTDQFREFIKNYFAKINEDN